MIQEKSILVVDDDPVFKLIVKKLFEKYGNNLKVQFVSNGHEALQTLKNAIDLKQIDLPKIILLDIQMPVMNGWEFMNEFVQLPVEIIGEIAVYIISSSIIQADRDRAKGYIQIKEFISKPLTVDVVNRILEA